VCDVYEANTGVRTVVMKQRRHAYTRLSLVACRSLSKYINHIQIHLHTIIHKLVLHINTHRQPLTIVNKMRATEPL
jgi:hypothetical protein